MTQRKAAWLSIFALLMAHTIALDAIAAADLQISAMNPFGATYWPGAWTPIQIDLRNDTDKEISGYIILPVRDEAGAAFMRVACRTPAHAQYKTIVYGYFPARDPQVSAPMAIVQWRDSAGKRLAEAEFLAECPSLKAPAKSSIYLTDFSASKGVLLDIEDAENSPPIDESPPVTIADTLSSARAMPSDSASALRDVLAAQSTAPIGIWHAQVRDLPRSSVGYDSVRVALLNLDQPDEMDQAQRQALLEYIQTGGVLMICAPGPESHLRESWLAPYLPMTVIGRRLAMSFTSGNFHLKFPVYISEAVAASSAKTLLRNRSYTDAAFSPLGLGRIVFTSFPAGAISAAGDGLTSFWTSALGLDTPPIIWKSTQLPANELPLLQSMIGHSAPAWNSAALVAGSYLLILFALQLVRRGPSRPSAFYAGAIVAVLCACGLIATHFAQAHDQPLQAAGLTTIDLSGDSQTGGGLQQESLCVLGDAGNITIQLTRPGGSLRPAFTAENAPIIDQQPFAQKNADVAPAHVNEILHTVAPTDPAVSVFADAVFTPAGLNLSMSNHSPSAISAPMLLWGSNSYRLPTVQIGESTVTITAADRNFAVGADADSRFRNSSAVITDIDRQRARVLGAACMTMSGQPTTLMPAAAPGIIAGWLRSDSASCFTSSPSWQSLDELALVRFPLMLRPSQVGQRLTIDAGFMRLESPDRSLPYDPTTGRWIEAGSDQGGQWAISFVPPAGVGRLAPKRALVDLIISIPSRTLTLSRATFMPGDPVPSDSTVITGQWSGGYNRSEKLSFDLSPSDFTADGRVWLMLSVNQPANLAPPVPIWSIQKFDLTLTADVIGPPLR